MQTLDTSKAAPLLPEYFTAEETFVGSIVDVIHNNTARGCRCHVELVQHQQLVVKKTTIPRRNKVIFCIRKGLMVVLRGGGGGAAAAAATTRVIFQDGTFLLIENCG